MRFAGEVASGNPKVMIYKFKADKGNGAYAVWSPTAENATVPGFALAVGKAKTASKIILKNGETSGVASSLSVAGGKVAFEVSEKPVLVLVDAI
jgi:hypothetical protein